MNLVLLGPPGSGKGTQAERLTAEYRIPAISTGDILRSEREAGTELGTRVRRYLDAGELVPDTLVIHIIRRRLNQSDTAAGFILDGFPRTQAQAEALDTTLAELGRPIDAVLYLEIGRQALVDRLGHRYLCPNCGAVYALSAAEAGGHNRCARDDAALVQRSDDRPEIVAHRIDVYLAQTAPLIEYYRRQGKLVPINGAQAPDEVYQVMSRRLTSTASP